MTKKSDSAPLLAIKVTRAPYWPWQELNQTPGWANLLLHPLVVITPWQDVRWGQPLPQMFSLL